VVSSNGTATQSDTAGVKRPAEDHLEWTSAGQGTDDSND